MGVVLPADQVITLPPATATLATVRKGVAQGDYKSASHNPALAMTPAAQWYGRVERYKAQKEHLADDTPALALLTVLKTKGAAVMHLRMLMLVGSSVVVAAQRCSSTVV